MKKTKQTAINTATPVRVEYRVLHYIVSHITGDSEPIALLHWDGLKLRASYAIWRLGKLCTKEQLPVALDTVEFWMNSAGEAAAKEATRIATNRIRLSDLLKGRSGLGGAFYWSPVVTEEASDPYKHFEQTQRSALVLDKNNVRGVVDATVVVPQETITVPGPSLAERVERLEKQVAEMQAALDRAADDGR